MHQVAKDISGHGNDLPLVTPPARKDMVIDKVRQGKHSQYVVIAWFTMLRVDALKQLSYGGSTLSAGIVFPALAVC